MTPAERIKAVKEIADALENEEWSDLQHIMDEFDLAPPEAWSGGTKRELVLASLARQADDKLRAVHAYAAGTGAPPVEANRAPWSGPRFRLFASHRAEDKELVGDVKRSLADHAIDLFVAHEDIDPSEEWLQVIESALTTCDALAAFLSPSFHGSDWCDQEVGYAMHGHVLIVPVSLGVLPYGFMNRYQALKAEKLDPAAIGSGIFDILRANNLTMARMGEAIVDQLVTADSFIQATQASGLLQHVQSWTPPLLRRLDEALQSNSQVSGSFKAPGRIQAILRNNSA